MDTIGVSGRVGLLLRRQHFALSDGVDGGVSVFPVLGESGDVEEVDRNFQRMRHVVGDSK